MFFDHQRETDSGQRIWTTSESHLRDAIRYRSQDAGYPVVCSFEYDDNQDVENVVISSVSGLDHGDRLDARHVTQARFDITTRSAVTEDEAELFDAPYLPSPSDEHFEIFEVELPMFDDLVESLHQNDDAVTAPISDETARNTVVEHYQDILINYEILNSQSLYGDLYNGSADEYQNMYANVRNFDPTLADVVWNDEETAGVQIDAAAASHENAWQDLFTIPYLFYQEALFEAYYSDSYRFHRSNHEHMYWAQTEMYDAVPSLSQCVTCACVRDESRLTDAGRCDDKEDCTTDF